MWLRTRPGLANQETTSTMKRNIVPLLGIAFVVAIISTGVFYGLFAGKLRSSTELPGHAIVVAARDLERGTVVQSSDLRVTETLGVLSGAFSKPEDATGVTLLASLKTNEPLLQERVTARPSDPAGSGGAVPSGMRAVTLHIFQSETVFSMLRPGSRIDLQAVSERSGGAELRTVLENVQVLAVNPADGGNRNNGAAVTVLVRAEDADPVALADAGSRIRVALRNPLDEKTTPRHSLALAALFSASGKIENKVETATPAPTRTVSDAGWDHVLQLNIRALSVNDAALEELRTQCSQVASDALWTVAAFHAGADAQRIVRKLEIKQQADIVASQRLTTSIGRPVTYQAGETASGLQVLFSPERLRGNKLGMQVEPRIGHSKGPHTQFPETTSFLLEAKPGDPGAGDLATQLFPGHSWEHKHLVLFVSMRSTGEVPAIARTDRGR